MNGVAVGQTAIGIPWLCPSAEALLTLTDSSANHTILIADVAVLAHIARFSRPSLLHDADPFSDQVLLQPNLVSSAATLLESLPHTDCSPKLPDGLRNASDLATLLAVELAGQSKIVSPNLAALVTRLAFLGWHAVTHVDSDVSSLCWTDPDHRRDPSVIQRRRFGFDVATITRRLAGRWRFPEWLVTTLASLRLPTADAVNLGAPEALFQIVQSAIACVEQKIAPLGIAAKIDATDSMFRNATQLLTGLRAKSQPVVQQPIARDILVRLLRATGEARRANGATWLAVAEERVDRITETLTELRVDFHHRLRDAKLTGLAEFAAGASHEINNPLAVISGHAQLMMAHEVDGEKQKQLRTIIRQTKRIQEILQGTRQFARPPLPHPELFHLNTWLPKIAASYQTDTNGKNVLIESIWDASDYAETLHVDPKQLQQALTHLVRNAIEAAPTGGWVRIGTDVSPTEIHVFVEDNGPGPSADQLDCVFDPFYSGREAGRGRGLGLSIAWRLAKQNGGDVRYCPTAEGTTRFALIFPRIIEQSSGNSQRKSA